MECRKIFQSYKKHLRIFGAIFSIVPIGLYFILSPQKVGLKIINLLSVIVFLLLIYLIWKLPKFQTGHAKDVKNGDNWRAENEFRRTLIQVFGGFIIIAGIFLSWEEFKQSRVEFRQSQENMKAGQISSRFSKAIELLSKDKTATAIGAIYALEQIAKESHDDYLETVLDVLATFVRDFEYLTYQGKKEKISKVMKELDEIEKKEGDSKEKENLFFDKIELCPEVRVSLTVIERIRYKVAETLEPGLTQKIKELKKKIEDVKDKKNGKEKENDLKKLRSELAQYETELKGKINSYRINLSGSTLIKTELFKADFRGVDLMEADLRKAKFWMADFRKADLRRAKLWGADFFKADLRGAYLMITDLREASLRGADLRKADFREAKLLWADLREADLRDTMGLEFEQLLEVKTLYKVQGLKPDLEAKLKKEKPVLFELPKEK